MVMTKEEIIKEAYGEYWNEIKSATCNKTGWVMSDYFDCRDYDIECDIDDKNYLWRAKSLQGIENNNGWIKIESEDDLPKEDLQCWLIDEEFGTDIGYFSFRTKKWFVDCEQFPTHYQQIQKPKTPIY